MFELNEPQKMMAQVLREYIKNEIQPHVEALEAGKMNPFELSRKMMMTLGGGDTSLLARPLEKLAAKREKGEEVKSGVGITAAVGGGEDGVGDDPMLMNILARELCRVSPGLAMAFGVSLGLAAGAIITKATARQLREYAIPIMKQEKIAAWCLTEPEAGSDAFGSMKSTARPTDDGGYILNGSKTFITNGPIADIFVVYAKIDRGQAPKDRPVNTFIVERGMKGFSSGEPFKKMGMKDSPTSEIFFDNIKLEKKHLIGEKETEAGRKSGKESLGNERSGVPAMAWGIIDRVYDECVAYVKERKQFGKPIGEFQAIQMRLYKIYMHLKNTENIVFRTAWLQKNNIRDNAFTNAAKAYVSQAAVESCNEAISIFGGYGYMAEYPIEKLYRDSKLLELGAGTTDINILSAMRTVLDM